MSKDKQLKYEENYDSTLPDEVPQYTGNSTEQRETSSEDLSWNLCEETLEQQEKEEFEILLDHEEGTAKLFHQKDSSELEEEYDLSRYQVMGGRMEIETEEYEWEPIRDLSGPTDGEKAAANLVSGSIVAAGRVTEASFKTAFQIISSIAE